MKPLDVIVNDINGGKINTWGKVMMYATMNGIDTNENILIELFKYINLEPFYKLIRHTVLSTNLADEYINDDFITTMLEYDGRVITRKMDLSNLSLFADKSTPTYMNSMEWLCIMEYRIPRTILKYIVKYETDENDIVFKKLGFKPTNAFIESLYHIRDRYRERYTLSNIEKFNEISKRLEVIARRIDNDLLYMR